jgi:hypothetical protein
MADEMTGKEKARLLELCQHDILRINCDEHRDKGARLPLPGDVARLASEHGGTAAILIITDGTKVEVAWSGMTKIEAASVANEAVRQLIGLV